MERNGLTDRERERSIGWWVTGITGFFLFTFFVAPLTIPPHTVEMVNGRANAFDFYSEQGWGSSGNVGEVGQIDDSGHAHEGYEWSEMNPFAAFAYAFGDLNCHQKHERSWSINDNQIPVCTRDLGIFSGIFLAGIVFTRRGWNRWTIKDTTLSLLPNQWLLPVYEKNRRISLWLGCGFLLCLPLILDGFLQLLTPYESTNVKRVLTGLPFGFGVGVLVCGMLIARATAFNGVAAVELPGSAKFVLKRTQDEAE